MNRAERLRQAVRLAVRPFFDGAEGMAADRHNSLCAEIDLIRKDVEAIQPAQVDMSQELADDIVRKIHGPLTISQDCSDWLRTLAPGADWWHTSPIGYSTSGGQLIAQIKTDGTLFIELRDCNGAAMWRGMLVPPDFGKPPQ